MARPPKPRWLAYWLLGFGLLAFGLPELVSVMDPEKGDTFSESAAWLVALPPGPTGEIALLGFLALLGWHLTKGRGTEWAFWRRGTR